MSCFPAMSGISLFCDDRPWGTLRRLVLVVFAADEEWSGLSSFCLVEPSVCGTCSLLWKLEMRRVRRLVYVLKDLEAHTS